MRITTIENVLNDSRNNPIQIIRTIIEIGIVVECNSTRNSKVKSKLRHVIYKRIEN